MIKSVMYTGFEDQPALLEKVRRLLEASKAVAVSMRHEVEALEKEKGDADIKLALQEVRTTDALRRVELVETRYWWLFTAIFVALLGLLATLIVALVKR